MVVYMAERRSYVPRGQIDGGKYRKPGAEAKARRKLRQLAIGLIQSAHGRGTSCTRPGRAVAGAGCLHTQNAGGPSL